MRQPRRKKPGEWQWYDFVIFTLFILMLLLAWTDMVIWIESWFG